MEVVEGCGFDHVIATRLHRDPDCAEALAASAGPHARWVPVPEANSAACDVTLADGRRAVVVASFERWQRDTLRTAELVARTEAKLLAPRAPDARRRAGRPGQDRPGRPAHRGRLAGGPAVRRRDRQGRFVYHYDEAAFVYEDLLAGRYVLATSLTPEQATPAQVVMAYRSLLEIERRFRVLRTCCPCARCGTGPSAGCGRMWRCVYATVMEALIARALRAADVRDPDLPEQFLSPERALRELGRIRAVTLSAGERRIDVVTRRNAVQSRILAALGVDTSASERPRIS